MKDLLCIYLKSIYVFVDFLFVLNLFFIIFLGWWEVGIFIRVVDKLKNDIGCFVYVYK